MNKIKILFLKTLIISLSVIVFAGILEKKYIDDRRDFEYLTVLNDKHLMAQNAPKNKILIVGASSSTFGFESDTLQKYLQKPVYNLGLIAPLGSNFILEYSEEKVKENDIVLMCFEYERRRFALNEERLSIADYYTFSKKDYSLKLDSEDNFKAIILHKIKNLKNLFWNILGNNDLENAKIEDTNSVYFRKAFSEKGDVLSHLNNPSSRFDKLNFHKDSLDFTEIIDDINVFIKKTKSKNVKTYFVFAPIANSTYQHGIKAIESYERQFRRKLNCQIIGKPTDFVYDDKYFFDSFYHLTQEGRNLRNQKVIELLKPILNN